ncbi:MAG: DUF359 domain-containing protein [Crenarchaeota archaeon]|nr:DUF359 domain-containing protein [Thermoproteota archaeon]
MRLPKELRTLLASPRGILVEDDSVLPELLKGREVVAVGDVTAKRCLELGIVPRTAIFDGRTRRSEWVELSAPNGVLKAVNPPGRICLEAARVVKEAVKEGRWVKVEGEEDLLAMPALLASEDGWVLLYGQPGAGVVLVEANEHTKAHFAELLALCEGDAEDLLEELYGDLGEALLRELDEGLYGLLFGEP